MTLDPKALEAAEAAHGKTCGGLLEGRPMANAVLAYLAALPQAEPVAFEASFQQPAGVHTATVRMLTYNRQEAEAYIEGKPNGVVRPLASPTPAVSREVQQWPEHASPLPWKYVRVDHGLGQTYDRIEDAFGGVVVEHVGHIDGPAIVAAANAAEPHHG